MEKTVFKLFVAPELKTTSKERAVSFAATFVIGLAFLGILYALRISISNPPFEAIEAPMEIPIEMVPDEIKQEILLRETNLEEIAAGKGNDPNKAASGRGTIGGENGGDNKAPGGLDNHFQTTDETAPSSSKIKPPNRNGLSGRLNERKPGQPGTSNDPYNNNSDYRGPGGNPNSNTPASNPGGVKGGGVTPGYGISSSVGNISRAATGSYVFSIHIECDNSFRVVNYFGGGSGGDRPGGLSRIQTIDAYMRKATISRGESVPCPATIKVSFNVTN